MSRTLSGKHAVLNFAPQYAPLFEPDGWCWCLSNPETRALLERLIAELLETFGNPPFFHIGCDEAHSMASCSVCSEQDSARLVGDHLRHFHAFLAARGATPLMWHDMLVDHEDPRWQGLIALGNKAQGLLNLYRELPRDIVICDWQYSDTPHASDGGDPWPISTFFSDQGFRTLLCPWTDMAGTLSQARYTEQHHRFGMLATTWNRCDGPDFYHIFFAAANGMWNPSYETDPRVAYATNLDACVRAVDADAGVDRYELFGKNNHYQIDPDRHLG